MSVDKFTPVPTTVKQIGDVVGIDRMDSLDRATKLDPRSKLELLAQETLAAIGRDPRGGGMVFAGRPRVVLQLILDVRDAAQLDVIRMECGVILGSDGGDVVCFWKGVPIVVRSATKDDKLYSLRLEDIPDSQMVDRRRAAEIRMSYHSGTLDRLRQN